MKRIMFCDRVVDDAREARESVALMTRYLRHSSLSAEQRQEFAAFVALVDAENAALEIFDRATCEVHQRKLSRDEFPRRVKLILRFFEDCGELDSFDRGFVHLYRNWSPPEGSAEAVARAELFSFFLDGRFAPISRRAEDRFRVARNLAPLTGMPGFHLDDREWIRTSFWSGFGRDNHYPLARTSFRLLLLLAKFFPGKEIRLMMK